MLPFLKEQGFAELSVQEPSTEVDEYTSDGTEEVQEQEYLTVAAQDKNVRKTTILFAVLFCSGLLCLGFMIKKSVPATAAAAEISAEELQVAEAISRFTGIRSEMFNRMDEIVKKFYEFSDVQQVSIGELTKNPFKYEIFLGGMAGMPDTKEIDLDIDVEIMNMQLLSIMRVPEGASSHLGSLQSGQPDVKSVCMIGDKILYEGDSIRGFKVCQIGDTFVRLELEEVGDGSESGEGHLEGSSSYEGKQDGTGARARPQIILKLVQ